MGDNCGNIFGFRTTAWGWRPVVAVLVSLVLLPGLLVTAPQALAAPPEELQPWLDSVSASGVPQLAVVVTRGDRVEIATGAGRIAGGPVDEHTAFRIESLSKGFTATAVLQLVERGRLGLDDPIVEYLPALRLDDDRAGAITVRHLLNQSSGLTDASLGFDQYASGPRSTGDVAALLTRSHLAFDPGTDWAYANPNYWLCAWLVAEVSGTDFDSYLRQEVLGPLQMTGTTSAATSHRVGGAAGHTSVYGRPAPVGAPDFWVAGAGGMTSTAHDLGIWLRFQHGQLSGSDHVLSAAMRHEMHRRQAPAGGLYALGWWSGPPADGGVPRVSHSGVGPGTGAYQGLFPDGVGVAVLQTAAAPDPYRVADSLQRASSGGTLGAAPAPSAPWRDVIITVGALVLLVLCGRGVLRARHWARTMRRRGAATLFGHALLAAIVLTLPAWASPLLGRAAPWPVLFAIAPVPVVGGWAVAAGLGLLTLSRVGHLISRRRRP